LRPLEIRGGITIHGLAVSAWTTKLVYKTVKLEQQIWWVSLEVAVFAHDLMGEFFV
jgi:hypothetical protein